MGSIETKVMKDPTKRDSRARRSVKAQAWDQPIPEYASSGLTQKAFCRWKALNLHQPNRAASGFYHKRDIASSDLFDPYQIRSTE